jgi:hypothetical protein
LSMLLISKLPSGFLRSPLSSSKWTFENYAGFDSRGSTYV